MYLIYFALALLAIVAILTIVCTIFRHWTPVMTKTVFLLLVIAVTVLLTCLVLYVNCRVVSENLQETHKNLMLYYNVVNHCTDEYVRYDYFSRAEEFNHLFEYHARMSNGFLEGLYPPGWTTGMTIIELPLHGIKY